MIPVHDALGLAGEEPIKPVHNALISNQKCDRTAMARTWARRGQATQSRVYDRFR